ncbi:C4-dicarboxylate TRAP transporter substrate-binding protein [Ruixingdingia sedimenti]|uniref:C4-dicarboxylate TRAP transporter substrate-binding protein n=1 Tax=Ruixingdingia sedimenti TaxID=3073604 RepID=A0ABU1F6I4_9RHOB|nr:C4-dicarboxylate TRAP transporter substrate-binding protein [Xinfangfangia sp. LG-4]MDR5652213.1 C4-dicarboxylate TRAP transporter substrate-binding protein [Xinfangfangia sp. LG-4]
MTYRRTLFAAAAALGAIAGAPAAQADTFSYAMNLNPTEPMPANAYIPWAESVKNRTNGDVTIEFYFSGALLPNAESLAGTRSGVADLAYHAFTYTPAEMPIWNVISFLGFKVPKPHVVAIAAAEYGLLDPEGNGEIAKAGVVYMGGYTTPAYHFICRSDKIAGAEDLKGLRVRTPGGPWSEFARSLGMVDVNITSAEMYTAFERGAVDCATADPTHIVTGANLLRVAKGFNTMPMGPFFTGASWIWNPDSWARISEENRKIVLEESARYLAVNITTYVADGEKAKQAGKDGGITFVEPSPDLVDAYQAFVADIDDIVVAKGKAAGVGNIEKEMADFTALMEKWDGLLKDVDVTDADVLGKLIWDNIYSKVDVATYGIR